jgi:hypothetical protein
VEAEKKSDPERILGEIEKIKFEKDILIQQVEELQRRMPALSRESDASDLETMTARYLAEKRRADLLAEEITENRHVKKAQQELAEARTRFEQMARNLIREVAELRNIHPLHSLLSAKRAEMERVFKALQRAPEGHPERQAFDQLLRDHHEEMAHLELLVKNAEQVIQYQINRIEEVSQSLLKKS